ncbi:MAG: elongation factor Ts, partial [Candidatus Marinimicrobia bacterium]|nr:elongation factor Ts [Candidatus Neomarinimicrobiota bacterium]
MSIDAKLVKTLREKTGAGMMDCKKALVDSKGDLDLAVDFLRKSGIAKAEKKSSRDANEGLVVSYIHHGSKLGVLLEIG